VLSGAGSMMFECKHPREPGIRSGTMFGDLCIGPSIGKLRLYHAVPSQLPNHPCHTVGKHAISLHGRSVLLAVSLYGQLWIPDAKRWPLLIAYLHTKDSLGFLTHLDC
jgi:hypothetical protein